MNVDIGPDIDNLMGLVGEQAESFLTDEIGLTVSAPPESGAARLYALVSSVPVSGALDGAIFLSASECTVLEIARRLLGAEITEDEKPLLLEDTLTEVLNMIVGKATRALAEIGLRINVAAASPVNNNELRARELGAGSVSRGHTIHTESGPVVLLYAAGR